MTKRTNKLYFSAHTNAINSLTTQNVINAVLNLPQTLNNLQNLSDLTKNINSNNETKLDDFSDIVSEKKIKTGMYPIFHLAQGTARENWSEIRTKTNFRLTARISSQVRDGQTE